MSEQGEWLTRYELFTVNQMLTPAIAPNSTMKNVFRSA